MRRQRVLRITGTIVAACAFIAYAVVIFRNISYVAAGADSSGYLNLARMLSRGRTSYVIEPLRTLGLDYSWIPALTPIGFTWGKANTGTMAPGYPPGLPAHMALAAAIGGWDVAPFLISPLAALGCGILMFAVGREIGLSRPGSFLASAALLLVPQTVSHAIQPVSDVLATFWALAAMWCVLRARVRPAMSFVAGAAYAIGVWVRPTNALLFVPILLAARFKPATLIRYVVAGIPFGVMLLAYQARVYGSPWATAYGTIGNVISLASIGTCARIFAKFLAYGSTWFVFPVGLFVILDVRRDVWTRVMLPLWFAVFFGFYCLWAPYDDWWSLRFLLPGTPGLIFGSVCLLESLATMFSTRWIRTCAIAVATAIGIFMIWRPIDADKRYGVLITDEQEAIYRDAVLWAEPQLPKNAIVMSGSLSGSFFYYADRFSVRPDQLTHERFQVLRAYAGARGLKWFALITPGEPQYDIPTTFGGRWHKVGELREAVLWQLDE